LDEKQDMHISSKNLPKILTNYKEEHNNFIVKDSADATLKITQHHVSTHITNKKGASFSAVSLSKIYNPSVIMRTHQIITN
jgi:hypothetical protein